MRLRNLLIVLGRIEIKMASAQAKGMGSINRTR